MNAEIWEKFNYDTHMVEDECEIEFDDESIHDRKITALEALLDMDEDVDDRGCWDEEGFTFIRNGETITIRRRG